MNNGKCNFPDTFSCMKSDTTFPTRFQFLLFLGNIAFFPAFKFAALCAARSANQFMRMREKIFRFRLRSYRASLYAHALCIYACPLTCTPVARVAK